MVDIRQVRVDEAPVFVIQSATDELAEGYPKDDICTPFTREQTCTAVAVPGGDRPLQISTPGPIDLLCCLIADHEGGRELPGRLEGLGIDARELQRCLSDLCQPSPADIERGLRPG